MSGSWHKQVCPLHVQIFIESFPQLIGTPFGLLARYFSDGLVLGVLDRSSGRCTVAPAADTKVRDCHGPASSV